MSTNANNEILLWNILPLSYESHKNAYDYLKCKKAFLSLKIMHHQFMLSLCGIFFFQRWDISVKILLLN